MNKCRKLLSPFVIWIFDTKIKVIMTMLSMFDITTRKNHKQLTQVSIIRTNRFLTNPHLEDGIHVKAVVKRCSMFNSC